MEQRNEQRTEDQTEPKENGTEVKIDKDLYSRQLYVLGESAMKRLTASSVLISGMDGLGLEIAKNVILAGVATVTIHDMKNCEMSDLASCFYLSEESIGKNRALEVLPQLRSLNSYVSVSASTEELTDEFISGFECIVLNGYHRESYIQRISDVCEKMGKMFILCETRGLFAYVFNDFGKRFVVTDVSGEEPSRFPISMISNAEQATVTTADGEHHGLGTNDICVFDSVEGMTEVNGHGYRVINRINWRQFTIDCDTREFGRYEWKNGFGNGTQEHQPQEMCFKPLKEALSNCEAFIQFGFFPMDGSQQVVLAFLASARLMDRAGSESADVIKYDDLMAMAEEINREFKIVERVNDVMLREFARELLTVIAPTSAAWGGIVGQEVLKCLSGKFIPIRQFLGLSWLDALPKCEIKFEPKGDRYDSYRQIFGNEQHDIMMNLHYFLVGAGAIGCEQLKNWALMGLGCGEKGQIYVTDMDSIEKSNLNRQFLFRSSDIGQMKSRAAAAAVQKMNPALKIEAQTNRIGKETEGIYNDRFYESLNGVCNALDNIETRIYTDQQCILHSIPLLDSGTLGPKAHFQVCMPNVSENYGTQRDSSEKAIPMCILHTFPTSIEHTCQWARNLFSGFFTTGAKEASVFLTDKDFVAKHRDDSGSLSETLRSAEKFLISERCDSWEDCVKWARLRFEEFFVNKIKDLITQFPRDAVTDDGVVFWGGNRRFPTPAQYDPENKMHAAFVFAGATIRARVCGITPGKEETIGKIVSEMEIPAWKPCLERISLDENTAVGEGMIEDIDALIAELRAAPPLVHDLSPEEFEKDDDSNSHIDFITAAANLRATNYEIKTADRLQIKRIAGRIIPAIATTTAMICGFVALEMYKVHSIVPKVLEEFRFASINLAANEFSVSEAAPPKRKTCPVNGLEFTPWTKWEIEGDLTLGQFIEQVKEKYNVTAEMVTVGSTLIYDDTEQDTPIMQERLKKRITQIIVEDFNHTPLGEGQYLLPIQVGSFDDSADIPTEIPCPVFVLKLS